MTLCRLCHSKSHDFMTVGGVAYLKCDHCGIRFMHEDHLPNIADEKAHYDHHENDPADSGYQKFLERLLIPLKAQLPKGADVLDFGSGPTISANPPALAMMMSAHGYHAHHFDPIYHNDQTCLMRDYDAVTATEVIEHFHNPRAMFDLIGKLLRPGGILAVMTMLQDNDTAFADWHYRRDPTHVVFYREESFEWIAKHYGYALARPHRNVAFFTKPMT